MPEAFVTTTEGAPRALDVVGEKITVLAAGARTNGYEIFLQVGAPGSGPPAHSHPWDESFYVIAGEVAFGIGDEETVAGPGTLVHLPAGTTHWFRVGEGGAEMLSVTSREGAAHLFADLDREIAPDSPDLDTLVEVAARHGVKVLPPAD